MGKTTSLAGFPKQPLTFSILTMHRLWEIHIQSKLKQWIEIVCGSKPLCFNEILGEYLL